MYIYISSGTVILEIVSNLSIQLTGPLGIESKNKKCYLMRNIDADVTARGVARAMGGTT